MNGTWIFRADGNSIIGMGHIMRCLSIADAARDRGETCIFALSDSCCESIIHERGYQAVVLNSRYDLIAAEVDDLVEVLKDK